MRPSRCPRLLRGLRRTLGTGGANARRRGTIRRAAERAETPSGTFPRTTSEERRARSLVQERRHLLRRRRDVPGLGRRRDRRFPRAAGPARPYRRARRELRLAAALL